MVNNTSNLESLGFISKNIPETTTRALRVETMIFMD
jgi:hypothetical protein